MITYTLNQGYDQEDVSNVIQNPILAYPVSLTEIGPRATILTEVPTQALIAVSDFAFSAAILEGEVVILFIAWRTVGGVNTINASFKVTLLAETVVGEEIV